MIVVSGWKIIGRPAWRFKYQVKLFNIALFPQYYSEYSYMDNNCFYEDYIYVCLYIVKLHNTLKIQQIN